MAKGQKHSNKEAKKPKQVKVAAPAAANFDKGLSIGGGNTNKKK